MTDSTKRPYRTSSDFPSFQDWFSDAWRAYHPMVETAPLTIKNITFVVTEECNLRCSYCYMIHKNHYNVMSDKVGRDAIDFILDDDRLNGYVHSQIHRGIILDFIGGEPLLKIDLINDMVEYFKFRTMELGHPWRQNYMINFSSNGVLYQSPKFQEFLERNPGRVSYGITIDGTKELHDACRVYPNGRGSYDDVARNAKQWIMDMPNSGTKVTLAPSNIMYLKDSILHLYKEFNLSHVHANCVYEDVWALKDAPVLYEQMKSLADVILEEQLYENHYCSLFEEHIGAPLPEEDNHNWCGGDGNMLAIGPDGTCYPCIRFMGYSLTTPDREPMSIGNIYDGIIPKDQSETIRCLQCITRRSQSTDECFNCPIADGCSWCTGYNYDIFGTPDKRATFLCVMHKARVLANVYYWNRLYRKLGMSERFAMHVPKEWALEIISEDEYNMLVELARD